MNFVCANKNAHTHTLVLILFEQAHVRFNGNLFAKPCSIYAHHVCLSMCAGVCMCVLDMGGDPSRIDECVCLESRTHSNSYDAFNTRRHRFSSERVCVVCVFFSCQSCTQGSNEAEPNVHALTHTHTLAWQTGPPCDKYTHTYARHDACFFLSVVVVIS